MRRDEPDIRYLFKPRSIAVKGRWEMEEIKEGDRVPS
jgi:hypothetical protein